MSGGGVGTGLSRRQLLAAAALGLGTAGLPDTAGAGLRNRDFAAVSAAPGGLPQARALAGVALVRDTIRLGVVQSPVVEFNARAAAAGRRASVRAMSESVARAFEHGCQHDLLFFHGAALTPPAHRRSRNELRRIAIELPGEESEQLGAVARAYACHLAFSAHVRDPGWPGRVLGLGVLLDDNGSIVARHWRLAHETGPDGEPHEPQVTTLDDVLDEYLERYERDTLVPIARTGLGNISLHAVPRAPELVRALAAQGCEIMLRSAPSGFSATDMAAGSLHNGIYTAVAAAAWPQDSLQTGFSVTSRSAVMGPRGETLAAAQTTGQQVLAVRIPIGAYRLRHHRPESPVRLLRILT